MRQRCFGKEILPGQPGIHQSLSYCRRFCDSSGPSRETPSLDRSQAISMGFASASDFFQSFLNLVNTGDFAFPPSQRGFRFDLYATVSPLMSLLPHLTAQAVN